jgi:NAD(P)-dependent dehydrogenase (short-subunit alcohol dehydrogenase family)
MRHGARMRSTAEDVMVDRPERLVEVLLEASLAPHRITSNCICPGAVDTPMWSKIDAEWSRLEGWEICEAWKRRTSLIPLGRPEAADDVAGVVSFLASRDSDYMTGQAVNVDGGLIMATEPTSKNARGKR